jgi:hypothetical protein
MKKRKKNKKELRKRRRGLISFMCAVLMSLNISTYLIIKLLRILAVGDSRLK